MNYVRFAVPDRKTLTLYYVLAAVHFVIMVYYCYISTAATVGLLARKVVLGTTHLFIFAGIAGTQAATGRGCPVTKLQNRVARKLGRNEMVNGFISRVLELLTGWGPSMRTMRITAVTCTLIIFSYYGAFFLGLI